MISFVIRFKYVSQKPNILPLSCSNTTDLISAKVEGGKKKSILICISILSLNNTELIRFLYLYRSNTVRGRIETG